MAETVNEVPAWLVGPDGPFHAMMPIPATEWLAERRAVPVGVSFAARWTPTREQLAYAQGRWDERFGSPLDELPLEQYVEVRRRRGFSV